MTPQLKCVHAVLGLVLLLTPARWALASETASPSTRVIDDWAKRKGLVVAPGVVDAITQDLKLAETAFLSGSEPPSRARLAAAADRALPEYLDSLMTKGPVTPLSSHVAVALGRGPFGFPRENPYGHLRVEAAEGVLLSIDDGPPTDEREFLVTKGSHLVHSHRAGHTCCNVRADVPSGGTALVACSSMPLTPPTKAHPH